MAIRVYLNPDWADWNNIRSFEVHRSETLPYVILKDVTLFGKVHIPEELEKVMKKITFHDNFYSDRPQGNRVQGKYIYNSAWATVERNPEGWHTVHIEATDPDDAQVLYEGIRAGTIARPNMSFEGPQHVPGAALWDLIGFLYTKIRTKKRPAIK